MFRSYHLSMVNIHHYVYHFFSERIGDILALQNVNAVLVNADHRIKHLAIIRSGCWSV